MYRKNLIGSDVNKLEHELANFIELKKDGKIQESHKALEASMSTHFGLEKGFLNTLPPDEFASILETQDYPVQKLSILAQMVFECAHPFEDLPEVYNRLHLVLVLFNQLEEKYHIQSLDNIARRQIIDKFLNTSQYE